MNWERCLVLIGQVVAVGVLGSLVALGHDTAVTDGLLAVCGSLAGIGLIQATRSKNPPGGS